MTNPRSTTWKIEPHSRAKHAILRRYLQAWTPILSLAGFSQYLYVDGFAGPGIYDGGEEGSPVIALKAALEHSATIKATLLFKFFERDTKRAKKLEETLAQIPRPANFRISVEPGKTFEQGMSELFDHYARRGQQLPPTFAFVDPFGWTGVPFSMIEKIMGCPSCEVLVNFMYEEINRFLDHPDQGDNFDDLFGTNSWRSLAAGSRSVRCKNIHALYQKQLQTTAKYVRSFEMRNQNDVTDYFLFFATNNPKGLAKMKEAMWKIDDTGEFKFSDATNPEQVRFDYVSNPDFSLLDQALLSHFHGKTCYVRQIEEFVLASTPFRETHYKKRLAVLEKQGLLAPVEAPAKRRAGTYPDLNLLLRFT